MLDLSPVSGKMRFFTVDRENRQKPRRPDGISGVFVSIAGIKPASGGRIRRRE